MTDQPFDQYSTGRPLGAPGEPGVPGEPGQQPDTGEVAKQEARSVGHDAKEGAGEVAQTAKEEVQHVAQEARSQVAGLYSQVRDDITIQAHEQQQRAAGGLHTLAGELQQMADSSDGSTMAGGLVRQASSRLDGVAGWLEDREPADLLHEVQRYARRHPGTFLGICALAGLIGGRLTRGLRDDSQAGQQPYGRTSYQPEVYDAGVYAEPLARPTAYGTTTYPEPGVGRPEVAPVAPVAPVAAVDPVDPVDPVEPVDPVTPAEQQAWVDTTAEEPRTEDGDHR